MNRPTIAVHLPSARHLRTPAILLAAALALSAGCGDAFSSGGSGSVGLMGFFPPTGVGDAHPAHRAYAGRPAPESAVAACATCHGVHGSATGVNETIVLRGGTSTAGGTLTQSAEGTSCTVACHYPFGAAPRALNWADQETCATCHATVNRFGAERRSSHDPIFSDADPAAGTIRPPATAPDATWCGSCHDRASSRHLDGAPRIVAPGALEATCLGCHQGQGQTLRSAAGPGYVEKTPPRFPAGWTDAVAGDFHGARAGTGYGGTLRAPYVRGQGPLPCLDCHAGHASANAFLLRPVVNGTAIPAGAIARNGVGAERLCNACHEGDRHGTCKGCHTDTRWPDGGFDGGTPVDPMPDGSPCFWCHGHEGVLHYTVPAVGSAGHRLPWIDACYHCHGFRGQPVGVDAIPPRMLSGQLSAGAPYLPQGAWPTQVILQPAGTVVALSQTSATIYWETDENASTWLEWGAGTAGNVTGHGDHRSYAWPCFTRFHTVTIEGLSPATAYVFRVRSEDDFRNAMVGPTGSFTTLDPLQPLAPLPVHHGDVWTPFEVSPVPSLLVWSAVTAPDGDPVEYLVQFGTDPSFAVLAAESGWISATSFEVMVPGSIDFVQTHYWRVKARDPIHGLESPWSTVDSFASAMINPYEG